MRGIPTGAVAQAEGFLLGGVGAFASGSELEEVVEGLGIPWDGGIESGIVRGVDIDERAHAGVGLTEGAMGAFFWVSAPGVGALLVRGAFDRAVEEDAVAFGVPGVSAHGQAGFTEGDALVVDPVGIAGRGRMDAVSGIEGDDGRDGFVG